MLFFRSALKDALIRNRTLFALGAVAAIQHNQATSHQQSACDSNFTSATPKFDTLAYTLKPVKFTNFGFNLGSLIIHTPLMAAVVSGNLPEVQRICDLYPQQINKQDINGNTVLHHLVLNREAMDSKTFNDIMRHLIHNGANPKIVNNCGETLFTLLHNLGLVEQVRLVQLWQDIRQVSLQRKTMLGPR